MTFPEVQRILVDRRNFSHYAEEVATKFRNPACNYVGYDYEAEDSNKHPGLIAQAKGKKVIFDLRRTNITGVSIYFDGDTKSYYFNLGHADVENRLEWYEFQYLLDQKHDRMQIVAHNAVCERTISLACHRYELKPLICTMYLCVSAYNTDTYTPASLPGAVMEALKPLIKDIVTTFHDYDPSKELSPEQAEVFYKFAGKETDSAWSYNGAVKEIAWGFGLKKAVKSWFGYDMMTYEQCLGGRKHMGQITGEEAFFYGCDDAIWCLRLYHALITWLSENSPGVIETFFRQENPMVEVYSDAWLHGIRIDRKAVLDRFGEERQKAGKVLVELREALASLLPFPSEPNKWLARDDGWYGKVDKAGVSGYTKYRDKVEKWIKLKPGTVEEELSRIGGSLYEEDEASSANTVFKSKKAPAGNVNLSHYMPVRTIIFDLFQEKPTYSKGKITSDADAKGRLFERVTKRIEKIEAGDQVDDDGVDLDFEKRKLNAIKKLNELSRIEQTMKLYLKPYQNLMDPETEHIYPLISALLNTRRTSMQDPNGQQWVKRGDSVYVRSFVLADDDDQVIISADWSSIELVLPGEMSGDPAFLDAFGQLPYKDLHIAAVCAALEPWKGVHMTPEQFKGMKAITDAVDEYLGLDLINHKGEKLTPAKFYSYARTEIGKVSNFNYWYSGALGSVGEKLGWSSDVMWAATERYRETFAVAEQWRKDTIETAVQTGKIVLPDNHVRYRFEATAEWAALMMQIFSAYKSDAIEKFGRLFVKKMQTRAKNQAVNALIQGTSATLAKRSAYRMRQKIKELGLRARFMLLIHDELLFSVHKDDVIPFVHLFREVMCDHPDIVKRVKLNVSVAMGRHFEPFTVKKENHKGQIELDEAPNAPWLSEEKWGKPLNDNEILRVLDYLYDKKMVEAA